MRSDGGPAFPTHLEDQFIQTPNGGWGRAAEYGWESKPGMSLRDWFAGQALIGLLAHGLANKEKIAGHAYDYADAMLAERAKGDQTP